MGPCKPSLQTFHHHRCLLLATCEFPSQTMHLSGSQFAFEHIQERIEVQTVGLQQGENPDDIALSYPEIESAVGNHTGEIIRLGFQR